MLDLLGDKPSAKGGPTITRMGMAVPISLVPDTPLPERQKLRNPISPTSLRAKNSPPDPIQQPTILQMWKGIAT